MRLLALPAATLTLTLWAGMALADQAPLVVVSIPPQVEFVQRICGTTCRVEVLVPPGQSPHTYEPTPKQAASLAEATVWICLGMPFERSLLRKLSDISPGLEIIDGCQGIDLEPVSGPGAPMPGGHGELDPHFWLDPQLVAVHVGVVREALCRLMPARCSGFDAALAAYRSDLEAADRRVAATLAPLAGRELYVYHPAYGYFARRYRLRQVAVEVDGKEPTGRQLAALIDQARAAGARALFVQPQLASPSARAAAEALGIPVMELDPMAPDVLANLQRMAERIAAALGR